MALHGGCKNIACFRSIQLLAQVGGQLLMLLIGWTGECTFLHLRVVRK